MKHVNCGGTIAADYTEPYVEKGHLLPAWRCCKCGAEVRQDAEVDLENPPDGWTTPEFKVAYSRARREWVGVIFRDADMVRKVLTIGCEDSQTAAHRWARESIALMERERRDDVEMPDKYERKCAV